MRTAFLDRIHQVREGEDLHVHIEGGYPRMLLLVGGFPPPPGSNAPPLKTGASRTIDTNFFDTTDIYTH